MYAVTAGQFPVSPPTTSDGQGELSVSQSRLLVLVSGTGSILQALVDACANPAFGARIVAVGADRDGTGGVDRASVAGVPTFVRRLADSPDRGDWDKALTQDCAAFKPDLVVAAGFLLPAHRR